MSEGRKYEQVQGSPEEENLSGYLGTQGAGPLLRMSWCDILRARTGTHQSSLVCRVREAEAAARILPGEVSGDLRSVPSLAGHGLPRGQLPGLSAQSSQRRAWPGRGPHGRWLRQTP